VTAAPTAPAPPPRTGATGPESVLGGLDPEQRKAVLAARGPVCILAGAGTGKTRTITHRIAHGVLTGQVPAGQLLAVTFTARAAGELRGRLRALGVGAGGPGGDVPVQARTFHAAALRQLSYFHPRVVGGAMPELVDSKIRLVATAAARCRVTVDRTGVRDLASEVEWAKATLVVPEAYATAVAAAGRETPRPPEEVARVYAAYEEVKRAQGVLDFDDLLLLTAAMIEQHRDVADEMRARYRHFVVDEYQDVNPLQQRLLDAWLGGRDDLCVVGDAQQTIYSFTGASPSYLLDFPRRFPGATVVRLVRDYRSTPQVVGLANGVLAAIGAAGRAGGQAAARLQLVAQRPAGPDPVFSEYDDEPAEASAVAARAGALVAAGVPASEIAVLYRVNAQSEAYEKALADAGVPYVVRGGERFFERPEVRQAVLLLRGAARSADAPAGLVEAAVEALSAAGWTPGAPPAGGAALERWQSLAALAALAEDVAAAQPEAGLDALVRELDERAAAQHAPTVEGVTLASLHAAKGLEWGAVFLVGLVDGTLPLVHAVTDAQVEEERRLLYVGVTRAREHLHLSWALARQPGGQRRRRPSRFLDSLLPRGASSPGSGPSAAGRRRERSGPVTCRVCGRPLATGAERKLRRCEGCPVSVDEALFDRLRDWRADRAKEQGHPAYVVFTDATLTAIAEARPASVAELVAIPGIGQSKLDRYGEDVLALIREA
jgi:DNA helicase-2/ATP-dependent DNA helicase PcrA